MRGLYGFVGFINTGGERQSPLSLEHRKQRKGSGESVDELKKTLYLASHSEQDI